MLTSMLSCQSSLAARASAASSSSISGQVIEDFESILNAAHPAIRHNIQTIKDIGAACRAIEHHKKNVGHLVQVLRNDDITLKDWASLQVVRMLMKETWPEVKDRTLDKYTSNLGSYLEMPPEHVPAYICISAPVRYWISAGTEIDVLDTRNRWWHGVALEVSRGRVKVFWVGFEKCVGGRNKTKNPESLVKSKRCFRPHEEGLDTCSGPAKTIDVAFILREEFAQPKSFQETQNDAASSHSFDGDIGSEVAADDVDEEGDVDEEDDDEEQENGDDEEQENGDDEEDDDEEEDGDDEDDDAGAALGSEDDEEVASENSNQLDKARAADISDKDDVDAEEGGDDEEDDAGAALGSEDDEEVASENSDQLDKARAADSSETDADDSSVTDSASTSASKSSSDDESSSKLDAEDCPSRGPASNMGNASSHGNDDEAHRQVRFRTMLKVFHDVDKAIVTLMGLHAGLPVHASLFGDLSSTLISVARFSAEHYCNTAYDTLVSETLTELGSYKGQEKEKLPHSKKFLKSLSAYGFCITPRLWKKEEILCIAIALLDPRLNFTAINQKNGNDSKTCYRGMALLDPRVQRIFYERLRLYGFVNPRFHPEKLQTFSSVVINGGGSWQQDTTWEFPVGTRFQMDTTAVPFMIEVSARGALEADGIYVATTSRKNGKPVYVQVSKHEYRGFKGQIGFKQCIKPSIKSLEKRFLCSQGKRLDACSPRVLICLNGSASAASEASKWGIQLLPAYGSDFFIFQFERGANSDQVEARCFAAMDFNKLESILHPCQLMVSNLYENSSEVLTKDSSKTGYAFSFGPSKIAISKMKIDFDPKFQVTPLDPQGFHSDGPIRSSYTLFDYSGKLKTSAPACRHRKQHIWTDMWNNPLKKYLPDHISIMQESFSALFGIFKGTYVQTRASIDGPRQDALNVDIPLGCAVLFTFAWKHRGKGDDAHTATSQSPVAVHARPHFYCLSSDMRKLPTVDFEASLEFLSVCAQNHSDSGSAILALDSLQTFDAASALGHWDAPEVHEFFSNQALLDEYVKCQLQEQRNPKNSSSPNIIQCSQWMLTLTAAQGGHQVLLRYNDAGSILHVPVTTACFDSDLPSFLDSKGVTYNLVGPPVEIAFPATNSDALKFKEDFETYLYGPTRPSRIAANQRTPLSLSAAPGCSSTNVPLSSTRRPARTSSRIVNNS